MGVRKTLTTAVMSVWMTLVSLPAHAGIPVIDISVLAQQIQQIIAWGQQAQQMMDQISQLQQQYQQMQTMTQKLDGARGLGTILNDPNIQNVLTPEMRDSMHLLLNPSSPATSQANINQILASFGVNTALNPTAGHSSADILGRVQQILSSTELRRAQLQSLASRVDSTADAKESLDLLNRNALEAANINNQMIQTAAALEAARQTTELHQLVRRQQFASDFSTGAASSIKTYNY